MSRRLSLVEARALLTAAKRGELTDSSFGDAEVWWKNAATGESIAEGYFGSRSRSVSLTAVPASQSNEGHDATSFRDDEADSLRYLGQLCESQSNNSDVAYIRDSENEPWRLDPRMNDFSA